MTNGARRFPLDVRKRNVIRRSILTLAVMAQTAIALRAAGAFTIGACYPETPNHDCSPIEVRRHDPILDGPIPEVGSRSAELNVGASYYYQFHDVGPGNYIVRTGGCNPFGCWLDTPVTVIDRDIDVLVRQIGPQTPTPMRSPTVTPTLASDCLGDSNGDHRVGVDELVGAVRNALSGCPDSEDEGPSLSVRVVRSDDAGTLRVVAELRHRGGSVVAYLSGCSALCRPLLYEPVYFTIIGLNGAEVFVESPCIGPFFCAEWPKEFAPGEYLEQELQITGAEWKQEGANLFECGSCTEHLLAPGPYVVIARFRYSTDLVQPYPFSQEIVALTEFTWP